MKKIILRLKAWRAKRIALRILTHPERYWDDDGNEISGDRNSSWDTAEPMVRYYIEQLWWFSWSRPATGRHYHFPAKSSEGCSSAQGAGGSVERAS